MSQVRIVIPCYNEARRLDQDRLLQFVAAHRNVVLTMVDDGSTDDTSTVLRNLSRQSRGRIEVLACEQNRGKAEAVRHGLLHVLQSPCIAVGFMDADLSAPPEACLHLTQVLLRNAEIDMVLGSRFLLSGRRIQRHWLRRQVSRTFAFVAGILLGISLRDTQCGAKIFRPTTALQAALEHPFRSRWIFDLELIGRFLANSPSTGHAAIYEMPLDQWQEIAGSKLRLRDFVRAACEVFVIAWDFRRGRYAQLANDRSIAFPPPHEAEKYRAAA